MVVPQSTTEGKAGCEMKRKLSESQVLEMSRTEQAKLPASVLNSLSVETLAKLPMVTTKKLNPAKDKELLEFIRKSEWHRKLGSELDNMKREDRELRLSLSGDDDDSLHRFLIELRDVTGIDVEKLWDEIPFSDLQAFAKAAVKKRISWKTVAVADCVPDRSTLSRHANDPAKPYIRKSKKPGCYEIDENFLHLYVDERHLNKYR